MLYPGLSENSAAAFQPHEGYLQLAVQACQTGEGEGSVGICKMQVKRGTDYDCADTAMLRSVGNIIFCTHMPTRNDFSGSQFLLHGGY